MWSLGIHAAIRLAASGHESDSMGNLGAALGPWPDPTLGRRAQTTNGSRCLSGPMDPRSRLPPWRATQWPVVGRPSSPGPFGTNSFGTRAQSAPYFLHRGVSGVCRSRFSLVSVDGTTRTCVQPSFLEFSGTKAGRTVGSMVLWLGSSRTLVSRMAGATNPGPHATRPRAMGEHATRVSCTIHPQRESKLVEFSIAF